MTAILRVHAPLTPVKIRGNGLPAHIDSVLLRPGNIVQYRLLFWHEGKRCDEYVYEHEIEVTPDARVVSIGFRTL